MTAPRREDEAPVAGPAAAVPEPSNPIDLFDAIRYQDGLTRWQDLSLAAQAIALRDGAGQPEDEAPE